MADPVYLNQGISDNPVADAQPEAMGLGSTTGQAAAASLSTAYNSWLGTNIAQLERPLVDYAATGLGLYGDPNTNQAFVNGDEANRRFGVQGATPEQSLKWDASETVDVNQATVARQIKLDKIQNDYVMSHRPQSWTAWGATEGADILGSAVDPGNLAFAIMPEAALGKGASLLARITGSAEGAAQAARLSSALSDTIIGRTANAGINNAGAVALLQPIVQAGEEQDHMDYGWAQAGQNILFGGLLGAGLHGVGEAFNGLAGATWRSGMRAGIASLDTGDNAGLMNQDLANADRSTVVNDLTAPDGTPPNEAAVTREMSARQSQIYDNIEQGKYESPLPEREPVDQEALPPDEIMEAASNGDFAKANPGLKSVVSDLEKEPDLANLSDEEKEQVNDPIQKFSSLKSAIADFTNCVSQEAA